MSAVTRWAAQLRGQRLRWQLTATDSGLCKLCSAVQLTGMYRAGQRRSWVPGIEYGAWSQLSFRLKKRKYVFCVFDDDSVREEELCVGRREILQNTGTE